MICVNVSKLKRYYHYLGLVTGNNYWNFVIFVMVLKFLQCRNILKAYLFVRNKYVKRNADVLIQRWLEGYESSTILPLWPITGSMHWCTTRLNLHLQYCHPELLIRLGVRIHTSGDPCQLPAPAQRMGYGHRRSYGNRHSLVRAQINVFHYEYNRGAGLARHFLIFDRDSGPFRSVLYRCFRFLFLFCLIVWPSRCFTVLKLVVIVVF